MSFIQIFVIFGIIFLFIIFMIVRNIFQNRELEQLSSDTDFFYDDDETLSDDSDVGAGIYSAKGHMRRVAILREEGQIDEVVLEIKKVKEIQETRDRIYFKSFRKLIEDNIKENKFAIAHKFLDKYEENLGASSEKQYSLVSYLPFQELYQMKTDVAIGLKQTDDAYKFALLTDWFRYHEQYERPINVLKFAYEEFITYLKELNGGTVTKKYLPSIKNYLSNISLASLDPEKFLSVQRIKQIEKEIKGKRSSDNINEFVKKTFQLPFNNFCNSLDTFLADGDVDQTLIHSSSFQYGSGKEIKFAMRYALQEIMRTNAYHATEKIEQGERLYKKTDGSLVRGSEIAIQFYKERNFNAHKSTANIFVIIYFLLFWDAIHAIVVPESDDIPVNTKHLKFKGLPEDCFRDGFQDRRYEFFAVRESELYEADLLDECRKAINKHPEEPCPVINKIGWDIINHGSIKQIFESFNKMKLINLFQFIANNFRLYKAMPDVYITPNDEGQGRFIIARHYDESFSETELFWILNLHYNLEIPTEIFYIHDPK
ncbi:MAG: hypothetical protein A2161_15610 [Candidatus Schekmanbacteria bacterium RBG_13_48_7]|uniref:Uncharacterized protein n=1 Tax=Candidatus Schekmanbacteria bacterium RBG_13_48_7 TaxID=1817878 RepID=A0A1F7RKK5_9BACT|nr:MAG: hypothetical protein A2161_15610 [Candidatus Schekmanbacteria bacterium RBG_13_48_7]